MMSLSSCEEKEKRRRGGEEEGRRGETWDKDVFHDRKGEDIIKMLSSCLELSLKQKDRIKTREPERHHTKTEVIFLWGVFFFMFPLHVFLLSLCFPMTHFPAVGARERDRLEDE